jgi:ATP-dependent Clp protease ATP-binding subunit ClpA
MFGVYSRGAEQVLAKALGSVGYKDEDDGTVGPEAIVLAMLDGGPAQDDLARRALDEHSVTFDAFENLLRETGMVPLSEEEKPAAPPLNAHMNLCLRRALQLALEDGTRIGTEHLLLGVLYERTCMAAFLLEKLGFTYENARDAIERERRVRKPDSDSAAPPILIPDAPQRTTRGSAAIAELARQVAEEDPASGGRLGTHHILLAVAMEGETGDPGGLAGRVLRSFGLSYPVLLARAQELSAPQEGGLGSDDPELVSRPPDWPLYDPPR